MRVFGLIIGIFQATGCLMGQPRSPEAVAVFPNPFSEQVTVAVDLLEGDTLGFELLNLSGARVLGFQKQIFHSTQQITLEVDSLRTGIYIASVEVNSERILRKVINQESVPKTFFQRAIGVQPYPEDGLLIYPNPLLTSKFTMALYTDSAFAKVTIWDMKGNRLLTRKIDNEHGLIRQGFDLSGWLPGNYLLVVDSDNGRSTRRLVFSGD